MKRTYGSEPILMASSPVTTLPWTKKKKSGLARWKRVVLFASGGLALLTGAGFFITRDDHASSESVFPATVRQTAIFPLLEPGALPANFTVDAASFQSAAEVVTFAVTYNDGKALIVSEQPVPEGFDFENFYSQFEDRKNITLSSGRAVLGRFEEADLASIVAGGTWVLIRAPYDIDTQQLELVVRSFAPSEQ